MKNLYKALRDRQQKEVNDFPFFFAFSNEQFEKGMRSLGLQPSETDKIYKLGNTGGFYRKTDSPRLHEMFDRHDKELHDAIAADSDGTGFIYQMFRYELANYEYGYTGDLEETIDALGLTVDEINASKTLLAGLRKATREIMKEEEEDNEQSSQEET